MESYIGGPGVIPCPSGMAMVVNTVQADALDSSATNVLVTLSGSLGTSYSLNALTPVNTKLEYLINEDITVSYTGTLNNVIINYVYREGRQEYNMRLDPARNPIPLPWRFN